LDGPGSPAPRPGGTRYISAASRRRPLHGHRPSLGLDGPGSPATLVPRHVVAHRWGWMAPARPRRAPEGRATLAPRRVVAPFTAIAHRWGWMAPARPRRAPEGRATLVPRRRLGMPVNAAAGCHGMATGLRLPLLRPYSPPLSPVP